MNDIPFNITREEVLNLAAAKLVDAFADDGDLHDRAESGIRQKVEDYFANQMKAQADAFLREQMQQILSQEICPVNLWGEREGTPTTLRAVLAQRAKDFWQVKVDADGKESNWGGVERYRRIMGEMLKDEFDKAVKDNATVVVAEFKKALKENAAKVCAEHIDRLINVK